MTKTSRYVIEFDEGGRLIIFNPHEKTRESCTVSISKVIWVHFAPSILLITAMLLVFQYYDLYSAIGSNLINRGDFERGLPDEAWQRWGNITWGPTHGYDHSAGVKMVAENQKNATVEYVIDDVSHYRYLRFRGRMQVQDIVKGEFPWSSAHLMLLFRDAQGDPLGRDPNALCNLTDTTMWKEYSSVFAVPEYSATAHIIAQNSAQSGTVWIDDIEITPVERKKSFSWLWTSFALSWSGIFVYGIYGIWVRRGRFRYAIISLVLLIIAGVICPQQTIETVTAKLMILSEKKVDAQAAVHTIFASRASEPHEKEGSMIKVGPKEASQDKQALFLLRAFIKNVTFLKRGAHVFLFAALSFLSFVWACPYNLQSKQERSNAGSLSGSPYFSGKAVLLLTGIGLVIFSTATEVLQFLVPTRGFGMIGVLSDFLGIAMGGGLSLWMLRKKKSE